MFLDLFPDHIFGLVHDKNAHTKRSREFRELRPDSLESALDTGYGVFFTPNGIGAVKKPNGFLYRWDGNVTRLNACFADFDHGEKEAQMREIASMPLVPSIIVESKRGYHAYWLLTDTTTNSGSISLWRRIQTTIAEKHGADKACSNPSRLMRLPGSWHVKGEPFKVNIIEQNDRRFSLDEMEIAFPPPPRTVYVLPRDKARARPVYMPPLGVVHDGERHATLNKIAGTMYRNVADRDFPLVREGVKAWYSLSCVNLKPEWESEVDGVCDWIEVQERTNRV